MRVYGASKHAISQSSVLQWTLRKKPNSNGKSDPFKSLAFFRRCGRVSRFRRLEKFRISHNSEIISRGFGRFYSYFCWHQTSFVPSKSRSKFYVSQGGEICESAQPRWIYLFSCRRCRELGRLSRCMGASMPWNRPGRPKGSFFGFGKWDPLFEGNLAWWNILIWPECLLYRVVHKFDVAGRMFVKAVRDIWYATLADIWSVIWCMIY